MSKAIARSCTIGSIVLSRWYSINLGCKLIESTQSEIKFIMERLSIICIVHGPHLNFHVPVSKMTEHAMQPANVPLGSLDGPKSVKMQTKAI